jgi:uncharacterized integral membrane protein
MKFLTALLGLLFFLACLVFALANQKSAVVSLWPFGLEIAAPLYVMTLGALAAGLLFGGLFVWLGALPHRFAARRLGKDVVALSNRLLELERELARRHAESGEKTPLLAGSKWRFWERR